MTGQALRLTGPDGQDYVLGDPIAVFDGETLIGRVRSVTLSPDGAEVLLENFMTVDFQGFRIGALPKLVLAEVVSFIAERHPAIHSIGIELSRAIADFDGREALLAKARSEILQSIGAQDILVSPRAAHFAVTGIWRYNTASVTALAEALRAQRDAYRADKSAKPAAPRNRFGQLLRKKAS
ncbi:hypothetical protein QTH97_33925 [Variovorax sp. J22R24]|uniref:hypothetical protein n=1 Tax=Variovorax gracilis TaxID=3053502 RepID=UPI002578C09B|nr:hypothetical protein [Variovorax sp. J22R24]MDM0109950.1 hypothetical protein [Variovorax sp. J22R24]